MRRSAARARRLARAQLALLLPACVLLACARRPATVPGTAERFSLSERLWIDVRGPRPFAAGHHPGALNLQWGWGQLAARIDAYVPSHATPLAVRGSSPLEQQRAVAFLRERGYADVIPAPNGADESAHLSVWTAAELRARLGESNPPIVIDVRSPAEQADGSIPGALLWGEDEAPLRIGELDPSREYALICEGGYRSGQVASLMLRRGFRRVVNVIDGMAGWRRLR